MSFNSIWDQYQLALYNFIYTKTTKKELSKDILQEIAIKLHKNLENKTPINNYKSWLFQVTRNTIADHYRKAGKLSELALSHDKLSSTITSESCVCDISGFVINNYLPESYGRPLYLSDIDKIPQKTIANTLGLSLSATKSRIQRARKMLFELIHECVEINYNTKGEITDYQLKSDCQLPSELIDEMEKIKLVI